MTRKVDSCEETEKNNDGTNRKYYGEWYDEVLEQFYDFYDAGAWESNANVEKDYPYVYAVLFSQARPSLTRCIITT